MRSADFESVNAPNGGRSHKPHMFVAVASTFSPAGPTTAGKCGVGVLSVGAHQPGGLISLQRTWELVEDAAAKAGTSVHRRDWRVVLPVYLADSREEAMRDMEPGYRRWNKEYFEETLGRPPDPDQDSLEAAVRRGGVIVGSPDDAVEAIERLIELSGGFGGLLLLAHEWAPREKLWRSYELLARYVAPRFQGQTEVVTRARDWVAANRSTIFAPDAAAIGKAFLDAGVEVPPELVQRMQRGRT